jgi:hypothetical protein
MNDLRMFNAKAMITPLRWSRCFEGAFDSVERFADAAVTDCVHGDLIALRKGLARGLFNKRGIEDRES